MTYTVFSLKGKILCRHDSYDTLEVAKDFAKEWVEFLGHQEEFVFDSAGKQVYSTLVDGIKPRKGKK